MTVENVVATAPSLQVVKQHPQKSKPVPPRDQRRSPQNRRFPEPLLDPVGRRLQGAPFLAMVEQHELVLAVVLQAAERHADPAHRQAVPMAVEQFARVAIHVVRHMRGIRHRHLAEKSARPVEVRALAADRHDPSHPPPGAGAATKGLPGAKRSRCGSPTAGAHQRVPNSESQ